MLWDPRADVDCASVSSSSQWRTVPSTDPVVPASVDLVDPWAEAPTREADLAGADGEEAVKNASAGRRHDERAVESSGRRGSPDSPGRRRRRPPVLGEMRQSFAAMVLERQRLMTVHLIAQPTVTFRTAMIHVAPRAMQAHPRVQRCVRATRDALDCIAHGDWEGFTQSLSEHYVLRVFNSFPQLLGMQRYAEPFVGVEGAYDAHLGTLSAVQWLGWTSEITPVVSERPGTVRVLISGRCTVRVLANGRTASWPYARFWTWDEEEGRVVEADYFEMDSDVGHAILAGPVDEPPQPPTASSSSPRPSSASEVSIPVHPYDADAPPLSSSSFSWPAADGPLPTGILLKAPSFDPSHGPLHPPPTVEASPVPLSADVDGLWAEFSSDAGAANHAIGIHPQEISVHDQAPPLWSAATPLASSSSSPLASAVVDSAAAPTSLCKLYRLLPGCAGVLPVSGGGTARRGVRSMCPSCAAACTVDSGSTGPQTGPTVFRPFTVACEHVIFVALRVLEGSGSPHAIDGSPRSPQPPEPSQRRKRRLKAPKDSAAASGAARRKVREAQTETRIDDQGRLMNRERTLTVVLPPPSTFSLPLSAAPSVVTLSAKRLTVHVSAAQERYVYVFADADDADRARAHWQRQAAHLHRVQLSSHRLHEALRLKYHHTGEEIQIAPDQLALLMHSDHRLVSD